MSMDTSPFELVEIHQPLSYVDGVFTFRQRNKGEGKTVSLTTEQAETQVRRLCGPGDLVFVDGEWSFRRPRNPKQGASK